MKTHLSTFQAIISFVLVPFLLVFCGCNKKPVKEGPLNVTMAHSSIDHLRMFFEDLHPHDQRSVFIGLPSELKYALFNNHWKNQLNITDNQNEKEFIQGLIDHLKPEYYDGTSALYGEGDNYFEKQIEVGLAVYQNDSSKVYSILSKIGGDTQAKRLLTFWEKPDCECNIKKGICFFGDCGRYDCKPTKAYGCGPAWLYACNGMCLD